MTFRKHLQPSLSGLFCLSYRTRQFLPGYFHAPLTGLGSSVDSGLIFATSAAIEYEIAPTNGAVKNSSYKHSDESHPDPKKVCQT